MTLEQKFAKIKHKNIFYTEVKLAVGTNISTQRSLWFNQTKGFQIPEEKHALVHACLDKCLKFEKEEQKVFEKYFN